MPLAVELEAEVSSQEGKPIVGARISIDGRVSGETDKTGRLRTSISGPSGRRAVIKVQCPTGWSADEGEQRDVHVRFLKPAVGNTDEFAPLETRFFCRPSKTRLVLIVRADGEAGLPVTSLGQAVAQTDADGFAQTTIEAAAGEEIELVLDTSSRPRLKPSMPSRRITVPQASQIVVFDQPFQRRPQAARRTNERVRLPVRL